MSRKVKDVVDQAKEEMDLQAWLDGSLDVCTIGFLANDFDDMTLDEMVDYLSTHRPGVVLQVRFFIGGVINDEYKCKLAHLMAKDKRTAKRALRRIKDLTEEERKILNGSS